ncbi:hypothetical protein ACIRYZ_39775 [Kitasatospora sp. NPDC101155]|uniref:hypothetical protein n=1 Tax=Kitasatospora sp. NPDC101155 TaxID=3364097 RepID=UPI00381E55EC
MDEDGQRVLGRRLGDAGGLARGVAVRGQAEVPTLDVPTVATPGRSPFTGPTPACRELPGATGTPQ